MQNWQLYLFEKYVMNKYNYQISKLVSKSNLTLQKCRAPKTTQPESPSRNCQITTYHVHDLEQAFSYVKKW